MLEMEGRARTFAELKSEGELRDGIKARRPHIHAVFFLRRVLGVGLIHSRSRLPWDQVAPRAAHFSASQ